MEFTYDQRAFSMKDKGDFMVVHNLSMTAVACFPGEELAKADAIARTGRAAELGLRCQYEVHHRNKGKGVTRDGV